MKINLLGINTGSELNQDLSCRMEDIVQDVYFHLSGILHLIVSKLQKLTITAPTAFPTRNMYHSVISQVNQLTH